MDKDFESGIDPKLQTTIEFQYDFPSLMIPDTSSISIEYCGGEVDEFSITDGCATAHYSITGNEQTYSTIKGFCTEEYCTEIALYRTEYTKSGKYNGNTQVSITPSLIRGYSGSVSMYYSSEKIVFYRNDKGRNIIEAKNIDEIPEDQMFQLQLVHGEHYDSIMNMIQLAKQFENVVYIPFEERI